LGLDAGALDELVDRVAAPKLLVVKTHAPLTPEIERHLDAGTAIASVSFRDPRDVAVSLLEAGVNERRRTNGREVFCRIHSLEDTLEPMREHLPYLRAWLRRDDVLHLPFDLLVEWPHAAAARIASQMSLEVDSQSIGERLFRSRDQVPEYNVGKKGRYRQVMTVAEQATFTAEFHREIEMIERLTAKARQLLR
jgi:hypothetical protein